MIDTQTLNEHDLRAQACRLREQADHILAKLQGMTALADLLDSAAAGHTSQEELQQAVDAQNAEHKDVGAIGARMDDAFEGDDPAAWAAAASEWLQLLLEDEARVVMNVLNDALVECTMDEIREFAAMPVASVARQ